MKHKIKEWIKRYVPAEIFATIGAILGSGIAYWLTNNGIVAAYVGTIGENIGYYGYISLKDLKKSLHKHKKKKRKYSPLSFLKDLRNLILEFGFSEFLDSFIVRPFCMWLFPIILNNFTVGIIVGKFVADIIFYIPTIIAYELKKKYVLDD